MKKSRLFIISVLAVVLIAAVVLFLVNKSDSVSSQSSDDRVKGVSTEEEENQSTGISTITPAEASELIAAHTGDDNLVILDIRTPEEYTTGHMDGARNIDYYNDFEANIASLDKSKIYLIYCRSGHRSSSALEIFTAAGFAEVHDISGGYDNWLAEEGN